MHTKRTLHFSTMLRCICTGIAVVSATAQADQIILDAAEIFDGGLFVDGDIEIVNGKVVLKNSPNQKSEEEVPDPAGHHVLELTDGSQIHGKLVSLGRAEIVWERTDANGPLIFSPEEVKRLVLEKEQALDPKKAGATLKLDSSDWLAGELAEMKDGKFQLQITPETRVEIERARVEWLSLSPSGPAPDAYEGPIGPMGLAGWDATTGAGGGWDYADGALVAKTAAAVSRTFAALPEQAELGFTAGDGGSSNRGFTLWVRPGSNIGRGYTKGAVYLRFQAASVSANYYTGEEIKNFSANLPVDKDDKKMTRYRLLLDRKGGRLIVHVNGKQAADWDLPELKEVPADALVSWQPTYVTSNMAWTLSNVRVQPWDGSVEPDAAGDEVGKDLLTAAGAPRKAGAIEAISGENVTLSGAEISRKEPLFLRLARKEAPEPTASVVARVWLASRGEFDVTALGFKDGKLRVRTSFSSDLTLPGGTIRAIEFPHKLAVTEKKAAEGGDRLVFKNGDQLRGNFIAGAHDKPMQWKPVKGDKIIEFAPPNVAGVLIGANVKAEAAPAGPTMSAAARLQNGDWIPGEFLSLDADGLRLKTTISAELKIARASVSTLYFGNESEAPVWDGASDRSEWAKSIAIPGYSNRTVAQRGAAPDPWHYLDGAFTLTSVTDLRYSNNGPGIGRILNGLPPKVDVSFDLSTPGGQAGYSIQLFFDENKPGFMVQGGWDNAYIYDMSPRQQAGVFFNQPQQLDFGEKVGSEGDTRRFRFLADRETGRMWMYVNGELVGSIGGRGGSKGLNPKPGKGVAIIPRSAQSRVTVANIWIAPWSGALPGGGVIGKAENEGSKGGEAPEPNAEAEEKQEPKPEAAPQDTVALANGDETFGTVLGATGGILKLQCDVGEIEVPLKRTTMIEFAGKAAEPSKGVRFRFGGKGAITVDSFAVADGKVTCRSATSGELSFPLSAVSEIIWATDAARAFNPAKVKAAANPNEEPPGIFLQRRLLIR